MNKQKLSPELLIAIQDASDDTKFDVFLYLGEPLLTNLYTGKLSNSTILELSGQTWVRRIELSLALQPATITQVVRPDFHVEKI